MEHLLCLQQVIKIEAEFDSLLEKSANTLNHTTRDNIEIVITHAMLNTVRFELNQYTDDTEFSSRVRDLKDRVLMGLIELRGYNGAYDDYIVEVYGSVIQILTSRD